MACAGPGSRHTELVPVAVDGRDPWVPVHRACAAAEVGELQGIVDSACGAVALIGGHPDTELGGCACRNARGRSRRGGCGAGCGGGWAGHGGGGEHREGRRGHHRGGNGPGTDEDTTHGSGASSAGGPGRKGSFRCTGGNVVTGSRARLSYFVDVPATMPPCRKCEVSCL